jgi:hypothetical protein
MFEGVLSLTTFWRRGDTMTERGWLPTTMTETEWLTSTTLRQMRDIDYCMERCGVLFAVECCRHVWHLLPDGPSRAAVLVAERYVDDLARKAVLETAEQEAFEAVENFMKEFPDMQFMAIPAYHAMRAASCLTGPTSGRRPISGAGHWTQKAMAWHLAPIPEQRKKREDIERTEENRQVAVVRDIFGNPFRPAVLDPLCLAWNDGAVVKLAQTIYEERAFERLPMLAGALEAAGCRDPEILNHCRQSGVHVRGCWVIDIILGKN